MSSSVDSASSQWMKNIHENKNTLLHVIDSHPLFLSCVLCETDMTQQEYQRIRAKNTNWDRNVELLRWLKSGEDRQRELRLHLFLEILTRDDEGQAHVASLIDGSKGSIPLTEAARRLIDTVKDQAVRSIEVSPMFLELLMERSVIIARHKEELDSIPVGSQKNLKLIEILQRRSSEAYTKFLEVLKSFRGECESKQRDAINLFETAHVMNIKKFLGPLTKNLTRTFDIGNMMLEREHITTEEHEEVFDSSNHYTVNKNFFDLILRKSTSAYYCFVDALMVHNQKHLYQLLHKSGYYLNMDHTKLIESCCSSLIKEISVEFMLLGYLYEKNVISDTEMEQIKSKKCSAQKVQKLLFLIKHKSADNFQLFLEALEKDDQAHVAKALRGDSTNGKEAKAKKRQRRDEQLDLESAAASTDVPGPSGMLKKQRRDEQLDLESAAALTDVSGPSAILNKPKGDAEVARPLDHESEPSKSNKKKSTLKKIRTTKLMELRDKSRVCVRVEIFKEPYKTERSYQMHATDNEKKVKLWAWKQSIIEKFDDGKFDLLAGQTYLVENALVNKTDKEYREEYLKDGYVPYELQIDNRTVITACRKLSSKKKKVPTATLR